MFLYKGKIYKVRHNDVGIGSKNSRFTFLTNCIIFSPSQDVELIEAEKIPCDFLITFDKHLVNGVTTSFYKECEFKDITIYDVQLIIKLLEINGQKHKISRILLGTDFRYNRKSNQIFSIHDIRKKQNI
jgi:hypothetical protein